MTDAVLVLRCLWKLLARERQVSGPAHVAGTSWADTEPAAFRRQPGRPA